MIVRTALPCVCLLGVAAAPAAAAWSGHQWLVQPMPDAGSRLGPVWGDAVGGTSALFDTRSPGSPVAGWSRARRPHGGGWIGPVAEAAPPEGLRPVAADAAGRVLATGLVAVPGGVVVAAALQVDGVWGAVSPLSGPLAAQGAGITPQGTLGTDGTVAVGWVEGDLTRVAVIDGTRIAQLAAPGPGRPVVRLNESGDVLAVWVRRAGAGEALMSARRPAGGSWTPPGFVAAPRTVPTGAFTFDADLSAAGVGLVVWEVGRRGGNRLWWTLSSGPGREWLTPAAVTPPVPAGRVEALRASASGDAVVLWSTVRGTFSATRPTGATGWVVDGRVTGAPGRARAVRAPIQVVSTRLGDVAVAWRLQGGVAVASRTVAPGPWSPPDVAPTPPGTLATRLGVGDSGAVAAAWVVTSGAGRGRVGVAARDGTAPASVNGVTATVTDTGFVASVDVAAPGRVAVDVRREGARRLVGTLIVDLPVGVTRLPVRGHVGGGLVPGERYVVTARTASGSGQASSPVLMPR